MKFDWKNLITPAAHLAEAALGAGQGNAKLAMVVNIMQTALLVASAAGVIPQSAATDLVTITNRVNEVVADENANGNLDKIKPLTPTSTLKK